MSHSQLVEIACKWLKQRSFPVVFHDKVKALLPTGENVDAIGFRSGVSCLVECKASRADFLADSKKPFRADPGLGVGDWRFYMAPTGLITPAELPAGWGLLEVSGGKVAAQVGVPGNADWIRKAPFRGNKDGEMAILYSIARRKAQE